MKKIMGLAMLAGATMAGAGAAHAEGTWSGNVALATDYVFRGISQTDSAPAVSGGFDYASGVFYAGAWGSNVAFGSSMELDVYAGVTPTTGPIAWNLGVLGYFYPGADDTADLDYFEAKIAPSFALTDSFTIGAAVFYSPEFTGDTGEGLYGEINGSLALSDALSITALYGNQEVDDLGGYTTWALGGKYSYSGFGFGLMYTDTEGAEGYGPDSITDSAVTFSISRAL